MKLTTDAQQSADFSKACYLKGLCTVKEYLAAIKTIYRDDLEKQITFMTERGFSRHGAIQNIYNIDKEATL